MFTFQVYLKRSEGHQSRADKREPTYYREDLSDGFESDGNLIACACHQMGYLPIGGGRTLCQIRK
jgi:hypothetical protein